MITDSDKIYAAGFFDGEGCVRVLKQRGTRMTSPQYVINAGMTNLNRGILDFLRDKFGGDIQERNRANRWRTCYELRLSPGNAIPFFKAILPYLKVKQSQVELALELHKIIEKSLRAKGQGAKTPAFETEAKEQLYQKIKLLNKRGREAMLAGMPLKLGYRREGNQLPLLH